MLHQQTTWDTGWLCNVWPIRVHRGALTLSHTPPSNHIKQWFCMYAPSPQNWKFLLTLFNWALSQNQNNYLFNVAIPPINQIRRYATGLTTIEDICNTSIPREEVRDVFKGEGSSHAYPPTTISLPSMAWRKKLCAQNFNCGSLFQESRWEGV